MDINAAKQQETCDLIKQNMPCVAIVDDGQKTALYTQNLNLFTIIGLLFVNLFKIALTMPADK